MFVTNHVLTGVVIGRLLERHPVTAFVVGLGSHLAQDMVPHWGCEMATADGRQLFLHYAKRDGLLGLFSRWHARPVQSIDGHAWPPLRQSPAQCCSMPTSP